MVSKKFLKIGKQVMVFFYKKVDLKPFLTMFLKTYQKLHLTMIYQAGQTFII